MNETTHDYRYRSRCSCCGATVTKEDLKLPDNNDSEGNLCGQCYGEQELLNWFEMQEMFNLVENALSPINRLKFKYEENYLKYHYCTKLMQRGILKWQIG